jgi:serine/threonine protein kinase
MPDKEDVWALGVTFYQLLFQRLPFAGETLFEIVNVIKEVGLKIPEDADCRIAEILTGMLTIDPRRRWGIPELLAHAAIAAAADRATDLPPVPSTRLADGDPELFLANVCPREMPFLDLVRSSARRSSFGGADAPPPPCPRAIPRTKSAPEGKFRFND